MKLIKQNGYTHNPHSMRDFFRSTKPSKPSLWREIQVVSLPMAFVFAGIALLNFLHHGAK
jgi:hypothetical protein